ncbi:MAG TPA: hypothetical protein VNZ56_13890, partial [Verrucomicrobiae bacterium]|nr:hypothetical protein [Verrucomicrobiae bacterium]
GYGQLGASCLIPSLRGCAHHFEASQGMQVQQMDPRQGYSAGYRSLDCVRDIVKFQVEENTGPELPQSFHRSWTGGRE